MERLERLVRNVVAYTGDGGKALEDLVASVDIRVLSDLGKSKPLNQTFHYNFRTDRSL